MQSLQLFITDHYFGVATTKPANTWHASNSLLKWLYTNTAKVFCRKCSILEYVMSDSGSGKS